MITFQVHTDLEAETLLAVLGNYVDNEHDKGHEGIGEDLIDRLATFVGELQIGQGAREVAADFLLLGLIQTALDIHTDGTVEEIFEIEGGDAAAQSMLARLLAVELAV